STPAASPPATGPEAPAPGRDPTPTRTARPGGDRLRAGPSSHPGSPAPETPLQPRRRRRYARHPSRLEAKPAPSSRTGARDDRPPGDSADATEDPPADRRPARRGRLDGRARPRPRPTGRAHPPRPGPPPQPRPLPRGGRRRDDRARRLHRRARR